jgi:hypothetical protein
MAKSKVNQLLTLAPEVLNNLIAKRADDGAKDIVQKPQQGNQFLQTVGNIAETAGDFLPGIFGTAAKIIGKLSKNHDDWFSGYKCAGVTPNEFLLCRQDSLPATGDMLSATRLSLVAAIAVNEEGMNFSTKVKEDQFPAMLAYVRNKCDNVLIEETDKYWQSFAFTSYLTATYYTMRKYMKLVKDYPLNIQQLEIPLRAASPTTLSQLKGIADALGDYLEATTRLPDAWNRYLHWRYGTVFMSDKSERSGLIIYDPTFLYLNDSEEDDAESGFISYGASSKDPAEFIQQITEIIAYCKEKLAESGRATADMKLAFNSVVIREVDPRHYDAKEFNLRCNADIGSAGGFNPKMRNLNRIIIDSELNMSAAIQGITTSTCRTDHASLSTAQITVPFILQERYIFTQFEANPPSISDGDKLGSGWIVLSDRDAKLSHYSNSSGTTKTGQLTGALIGAYKQSGAKAVGNENLNADYVEIMRAMYYTLGCIALQCHWANPQFILSFASNQIVFESQPLAYDTAYITDDQLTTIQRTALRNLFRGEYKFSIAEEKKDAQEAIADVAKVVEKVD